MKIPPKSKARRLLQRNGTEKPQPRSPGESQRPSAAPQMRRVWAQVSCPHPAASPLLVEGAADGEPLRGR